MFRVRPRGIAAFIGEGAFTLMELLVVLVIVGVLAGMALPRFSNFSEQAKEKRALSELKTLETAIELYNSDKGFLPDTSGADKTIAVLKSELNSYVNNLPTADPWSGAYTYKYLNSGGYAYKIWASGKENVYLYSE